jgi:acyl-CoA-binding protein
MTHSEDLTQEFEDSIKQIKNCGKTFDNDILLKLYGYYKQSCVGDCDIECPSFWQVKEKAKWDAWNQHKGMKKDHAMKRYIKLVSKLLE